MRNRRFSLKYWGFSWVSVPSVTWIYAIYIGLAFCSLAIAIGFFYRASALVFFVGFTYVELFDVTNYLNHYYLVSSLRPLAGHLSAPPTRLYRFAVETGAEERDSPRMVPAVVSFADRAGLHFCGARKVSNRLVAPRPTAKLVVHRADRHRGGRSASRRALGRLRRQLVRVSFSIRRSCFGSFGNGHGRLRISSCSGFTS